MTTAAPERRRLVDLVDLAKQGSREDRNLLYHKIADLFQQGREGLAGSERALLREIMATLASQVEVSLRLRLAETLAGDPNASHDLILLLANDKIEVAGPILRESGALSDDDLIAIIRAHGTEHQKAIAVRSVLSVVVTRALIATKTDEVLVRVAENRGAQISQLDFAALIARARGHEPLQPALVARADLPRDLAASMCSFVSQSLRARILADHKIDPATLDKGLAEAVKGELAGSGPEPKHQSYLKLVDKLSANGQLKTTFLIKALRDGQVDLFKVALGQLLSLPMREIEAVCAAQSPAPLALAARAAGIDRSAFPSVMEGVRGKGAFAAVSAEQREPLLQALQIASSSEALAALRTWLR